MTSPPTVKVFIANHTNPWFNLATEDWIFRDMDPATKILFLWRNQETVVIGRFQNPWSECNLEAMERDGILLSRRQSGGGAVFHDLGNTNFTFLSGKSDYNKQANNQIITTALSACGVQAQASGRNDILVEGRKISGAAFKETKDRAFHHGTLLINANLDRLTLYLNPKKRKLESKGIASVRSRVANLIEFQNELTHEKLSNEIIQSFFKYHGAQGPIEYLNTQNLENIPPLMNYYQHLSSWQWRFGETPKFSQTLEIATPLGHFDFHLNSHKGLITDAKIFSDCLDVQLVELLEKYLVGQGHDGLNAHEAPLFFTDQPERQENVNELWKILISEL